ncbi:MAG: hypothetical protein A4E66_01323 [Syntrophus sp. PtaB.Bin001]|nr:MAG: hypothetical protein A4E66_01323 [Syntrophus sp. PtaB.Bin001]
MTMQNIRSALGWCSLMSLCLLCVWFLSFTLAHDWMYHLHNRWFHLSPETFDSIHYAGMALFKVEIWLLNLIPYLALHIVGQKV